MNKRERRYRAICGREGLTLLSVEHRRKHMAFVCVEGTIFCASTPSDWRDERNFAARVRKLSH